MDQDAENVTSSAEAVRQETDAAIGRAASREALVMQAVAALRVSHVDRPAAFVREALRRELDALGIETAGMADDELDPLVDQVLRG